jgi:hypothetical protein
VRSAAGGIDRSAPAEYILAQRHTRLSRKELPMPAKKKAAKKAAPKARKATKKTAKKR